MYTDEDIERLEVILKLTRDLGVNLAGVEIILNMREKMAVMERQMQEFIAQLDMELSHRVPVGVDKEEHSLVRVLDVRTVIRRK